LGYIQRGIFDEQTLRNLDAAKADFTRAIELNPYQAQPYAERGVFYMKIGDYDSAVTDFKQAIAIDPNNDEAIYTLGSLYGQLGHYQDSVNAYTKAINPIGTYDVAAYLYRAQDYAALGDYDSALSDLNFYLGDPPGTDFRTVALMLRGYVYLSRGEYEQATNDYVDAFNYYPEFARNYAYWGSGYWVTPLEMQRIIDLQNQIAASPKQDDLYLQLGNLEMEFGRWQEAIDTYQQYLALTPNEALSDFVDKLSSRIQ
jgi:tetratricopeptide (TPR) repeat protein